jgi:hypothetical protein
MDLPPLSDLARFAKYGSAQEVDARLREMSCYGGYVHDRCKSGRIGPVREKLQQSAQEVARAERAYQRLYYALNPKSSEAARRDDLSGLRKLLGPDYAAGKMPRMIPAAYEQDFRLWLKERKEVQEGPYPPLADLDQFRKVSGAEQLAAYHDDCRMFNRYLHHNVLDKKLSLETAEKLWIDLGRAEEVNEWLRSAADPKSAEWKRQVALLRLRQLLGQDYTSGKLPPAIPPAYEQEVRTWEKKRVEAIRKMGSP